MHKITKLKAADNALYPTASTHDDYRESIASGDNLSPNVDYWIIGEVLIGPTVGKSLLVKRYIRNGLEIPGMFNTSEITEITEDGFKTLNSEYRMEKL